MKSWTIKRWMLKTFGRANAVVTTLKTAMKDLKEVEFVL